MKIYKSDTIIKKKYKLPDYIKKIQDDHINKKDLL